MKDQIDDLLYEYGFRRYPNLPKKGWFLKYEASGTPGLTQSEQAINDRGGMYHGTDSRKILEIALSDLEASLHGFEDDELSDRMRWEKSWCDRAREALDRVEM